ncbi:hypothetical protein [uncultured Methanobrevibacter sp.]|uniref:hypothetical protein n=1 Tax=uncultured Methanobrevibacter sp. TaxID=253161 RepID=UPI0025D1076F|nr:hypothetical protein [uncultured Methanobrevibacter sp.]
MSYIFILADNTNKINNDSIFNNSTNLQNKHDDKNISLNHTNNTDDGIEGDINNNYYKSSSSNNNRGHDKNNSNDSFDEALEAKLDVERNVSLEKNEIVGYSVYKDPDLNAWLVPIFDKYTKEFKGSIYVCGKPGYHYYVHGPEFYSDYKRVISGKTPKSGPDITSSEAAEMNKEPPIRYVLAAVNPDMKEDYSSSNIPLDVQSEGVVELDANQQYSTESYSQNTEIINEE